LLARRVNVSKKQGYVMLAHERHPAGRIEPGAICLMIAFGGIIGPLAFINGFIRNGALVLANGSLPCLVDTRTDSVYLGLGKNILRVVIRWSVSCTSKVTMGEISVGTDVNVASTIY
jgi:hypothetical protein